MTRGSEFQPYFCSKPTRDSPGMGGPWGLCALLHRKGTGVPRHLLWPFTPASPSKAHAMLSSLPDAVSPRDKVPLLGLHSSAQSRG